jgi:hypothetical protein
MQTNFIQGLTGFVGGFVLGYGLLLPTQLYFLGAERVIELHKERAASLEARICGSINRHTGP